MRRSFPEYSTAMKTRIIFYTHFDWLTLVIKIITIFLLMLSKFKFWLSYFIIVPCMHMERWKRLFAIKGHSSRFSERLCTNLYKVSILYIYTTKHYLNIKLWLELICYPRNMIPSCFVSRMTNCLSKLSTKHLFIFLQNANC